MNLSRSAGLWEQLRQQLEQPEILREKGLLSLLFSTALAEVAGNIVYVALLERAFQLGGEIASVGGVLLVQSAPQLALGVWAGSLVDRLGKRRAAILSTLAYAMLVAGLLMAQTIWSLLILAFLMMLARLILIPARLALVSHNSSKANLVAANTALMIVTGLGIFLGPAISAVLTLRTGGFQMPLLVAGLGFMLSVLPLLFVHSPVISEPHVERTSIREEMRIGWRFIRRHTPVRQVLLCLVHIMLIMGAIMPLLTPLAHEFGLGLEGSGVFFSAVGLGGLIGAPLAVAMARRLSPAIILLFAGLLVPVGALFIGVTDNLEGVLVAIVFIHLAEVSLNIIVVTILQRLTPLKIQGYVFGVQQTLLGAAWVASLAMVTGGMTLWPQGADLQSLFLWIGGVGILAILTCWLRYRHQIQAGCQTCQPRLKALGAACQVICASQSRLSGAACRLICGR